jgi:hypothetical protein
LAIKILYKNGAAGPADSDHFGYRLVSIGQILEEHSGIDQVETIRWKRQCVSICLDELQARVGAILFRRLLHTREAYIDSRTLNRRLP